MIRYDALLEGCSRTPTLMAAVHSAMSRELARDRDSMMAMRTLPQTHAWPTLRTGRTRLRSAACTDCITLRMTRAEIGNFLGMKFGDRQPGAVQTGADKVIGF